MVCAGLETLTDTSITAILSYPTSCDYYFYLKIFGAFFVILAFTTFQVERKTLGRGNFLSSIGVSAMATLFVGLAARVFGILQRDIYVIMIVVGIIIISVWSFSSND